MLTIGLDIGSATSKCVLLEDGGAKIVAHALVPAGIGTNAAHQALEKLFEEAGDNGTNVNKNDVSSMAVTGYGRNTWNDDSIGERVLTVSELTCHGMGANYYFPEVHTIIDIGGQDSKVITLDDKGTMKNFMMNDKCAAGTGRFLEVMAGVLQLDINDISKEALNADKSASISSTCTVFAESEVISQLAAGTSISEVAAGICESVATKATTLARQVGVIPQVCMSGGVAQNEAVRIAIGRALGQEILYSPMAQYFGALGAAIYAFKKR